MAGRTDGYLPLDGILSGEQWQAVHGQVLGSKTPLCRMHLRKSSI